MVWSDHYSAVGTGSNIAAAFLHQRNYYDTMSLSECFYRVMEAKTAAERNPYVGRVTLLEFSLKDDSYAVDMDWIESLADQIRQSRLEVPSTSFGPEKAKRIRGKLKIMAAEEFEESPC